MTPEEYQRIKEAEKEHLRALKKLKETARLLERRKSVNSALGDMVGGAQHTQDVHDEMLNKLALETAQQEARLEIALENARLDETSPAEASTRAPEALEEEMLKERANLLLKQMKLQMGIPPEEKTGTADQTPPASSQPSAKSSSSPAPAKPSPPSDRPEKTIGRMR